jgi:hypothetical protein
VVTPSWNCAIEGPKSAPCIRVVFRIFFLFPLKVNPGKSQRVQRNEGKHARKCKKKKVIIVNTFNM